MGQSLAALDLYMHWEMEEQNVFILRFSGNQVNGGVEASMPGMMPQRLSASDPSVSGGRNTQTDASVMKGSSFYSSGLQREGLTSRGIVAKRIACSDGLGKNPAKQAGRALLTSAASILLVSSPLHITVVGRNTAQRSREPLKQERCIYSCCRSPSAALSEQWSPTILQQKTSSICTSTQPPPCCRVGLG